jgi:hypothetical protein
VPNAPTEVGSMAAIRCERMKRGLYAGFEGKRTHNESVDVGGGGGDLDEESKLKVRPRSPDRLTSRALASGARPGAFLPSPKMSSTYYCIWSFVVHRERVVLVRHKSSPVTGHLPTQGAPMWCLYSSHYISGPNNTG